MRVQHLIVLYSLLVFAVLWALVGIPGLSTSTEARELEVIKTIFNTGEWLLPLRNGLIPSKPPLFHWCGALLAHLFGQESVFGARIVSAAFGCLTIIVVSLTTARIFNTRNSAAYALATCAVLTLSFGFTSQMTEARVDMIGCFFVVGALCAFFKDLRSDAAVPYLPSPLAFNLFWVACALGFLARGPIGIALPVLIASVTTLYLCGFSSAMRLWIRPRIGWLCVLLALSWYWVAFSRAGDSFLQKQLFFENLQRFTGGERVNTKPIWFYLPNFLRLNFPWSVVLLVASWSWLRLSIGGSRYDPAHRAKGVFLIWFWLGLTLFSIASGKRPSYLLPMLPAMAVLVGVSLVDYYQHGSDSFRQWIWKLLCAATRIWPVIILAVVLIEAMKLPIPGESVGFNELRLFLNSSNITERFQITLLLIPFAAVLFGVNRAELTQLRSVRLSFIYTALMLVGLLFGLTCKARLQGFDLLARRIAAKVDSAQLAVVKESWDERFDLLTYYMPKQVIYKDLEAGEVGCNAQQKLCQQPILASAEWFAQFAASAQQTSQGVEQLGRFQKWRAERDPQLGDQFVLFKVTPTLAGNGTS